MTPKELATKIDGLVISANERYASAIASVQNQLYNALVTILKDLELDADGFIKQNSTNRRILQLAQSEFDAVISGSAYQASLEKYLKNIPTIDSLNADYFNTISSAFTPNKNFIKALQKQTIQNVNTMLLNDGLAAGIKAPLQQILSQNINQGGSFSGFLQEVQTFIKGNPKLDGRLMSYSRNILNDVLFNYSRGYQQAVTNDLGLEFYRYIGGLTKDSRPFCMERAGNFYHHNEIESWASLIWAGKNNLTTASSIFTLAGGHQCRHFIVPVSTLIVPQEVIDRNIASGNYKP